MWDVIFRVGGAVGTELTMKECHWTRKFTSPKGKYQGPADKCMAATLIGVQHVTEKSSIYIENTWLWVAGKFQFSRRHFAALMRLSTNDIDSPQQTRINVYGAQGALIESKGPHGFKAFHLSIRHCSTGN